MEPNTRVGVLLQALDQYLEEIEERMPQDYTEYEDDLEKRRFIERTLQISIEACIDICHHLIKEKRLGFITNEDNMFEKLATAKIISKELRDKLKDMKGFRNVLVHRYVELDDEKAYHHATHDREDFDQFRREIRTYLTSTKNASKKNKPKK